MAMQAYTAFTVGYRAGPEAGAITGPTVQSHTAVRGQCIRSTHSNFCIYNPCTKLFVLWHSRLSASSGCQELPHFCFCCFPLLLLCCQVSFKTGQSRHHLQAAYSQQCVPPSIAVMVNNATSCMQLHLLCMLPSGGQAAAVFSNLTSYTPSIRLRVQHPKQTRNINLTSVVATELPT